MFIGCGVRPCSRALALGFPLCDGFRDSVSDSCRLREQRLFRRAVRGTSPPCIHDQAAGLYFRTLLLDSVLCLVCLFASSLVKFLHSTARRLGGDISVACVRLPGASMHRARYVPRKFAGRHGPVRAHERRVSDRCWPWVRSVPCMLHRSIEIALPCRLATCPSSSTRMKKNTRIPSYLSVRRWHWRRLGDADVGVQTMTRSAVWMTGLTGGSPAVQQGSR